MFITNIVEDFSNIPLCKCDFDEYVNFLKMGLTPVYSKGQEYYFLVSDIEFAKRNIINKEIITDKNGGV